MGHQRLAISIDGVAQVKVNADTDASLQLAVQNFLGMKEQQIVSILNETLEGHQRAIISTMSVENVFQDRVQFAENVRNCATPDLLKMGMSIISYTISSVRTGNGYLAALGKPSIALVKRDARIGEAEANKYAAIAIAEASQQRDEKVYSTKREIVQMQQDRDMVLQANKKEVN